MKLTKFRIQMYRNIIDSGWINLEHLTAIVGKNESGKTALLKALHKLNPFYPDPYRMDNEWPRGKRRERNSKQIVCTAQFELEPDEIEFLNSLIESEFKKNIIKITKDYDGRIEIDLPQDLFLDQIHPNDIEEICADLPELPTNFDESFQEDLQNVHKEYIKKFTHLAHQGRFNELSSIREKHTQTLQKAGIPLNQQDPYNQSHYISQQEQQREDIIRNYLNKVKKIEDQLKKAPSIQQKAHNHVVENLPTFIYMDDYRRFEGQASLDQVKQRRDQKNSTPQDETFLMILKLSGLDLEDLIKKDNSGNQEDRQYDLDDAALSLTREIENRWKQKKYNLAFRVDGQKFFTMVEDETHYGLIRLAERSKGFQWFFSFDLLLMHETQGTFRNSVILLDEPGLHLHPEAQRDLLQRLEAYAEGNLLIYTTHLPFMLDLHKPERLRIISESENGAVVHSDLALSQPEGRLTLEAALGMSARTSYLVAQKNLVVEGVHDYWLITALSNLLKRSGRAGLSDDIHITPAGGASEAVYIATFMVGQNLDVVALFDSDKEGENSAERLTKKWLTQYSSGCASTLMVADAIKADHKDCAIEDIFTAEFYLRFVFDKIESDKIQLPKNGQLVKRVEQACKNLRVPFNKGSVAKRIKNYLNSLPNIDKLPSEIPERAQSLMQAITKALQLDD